ncbi:MAG: glycoside hydrolase family 10 protein [Gemmatimonadaceae bacterium]
MPRNLTRLFFIVASTLAALNEACAQTPANSPEQIPPPPPVRREFRGVWIATVQNIDWPSRPGLSSQEQQQELLDMLDRAAELRLNAVILQVRPAADALYASPYEPWSEYLSGVMGRAPSPYYDPLEFAVREAHKRGLELHAWLNPYRAKHPSGRSRPAPNHISVTNPELVKRYGTHLWMDPGEPEVRAHTLKVVLDVVKRYDIDGVHIDDYFYPYRERDARGRVIDFPDANSWRRYLASGGNLSRDDWRRANVDSLIHQVYVGIKALKPWVKFGISPFGVWRPGYPPEVKGFDSFAELYGDSRKWVLNGWGDYFTPQLYWPTYRPDLPYAVLLRWWVEQNRTGRHIWPGNYVDKVDGTLTGWPAQELLDQISATRSQPGATGNVYFSMRTLMIGKDSLPERLMAGPYAERALVPASPWLDHVPPLAPIVSIKSDTTARTVTVLFQPQGAEPTWLWVVRLRVGSNWTTEIFPGTQQSYIVRPFAGGVYSDALSVTAVDRTGNESPSVIRSLATQAPR